MTQFFIPTGGPQDWQKLLADPEKHWKAGYSAYSLAMAWEGAKGHFPGEVEKTLTGSGDDGLADLEILAAFPEWKVYLPPKNSHPSQNDLFVLARGKPGLATIMIEGKVAESFGPRLQEWSSPLTPGKKERLAFIQSKLGLHGDLPGTIRYQLLHRTVSAVLEAERFQAKTAVTLVHSFSPECQWFDDFASFLALFAVKSAQTGKLYSLTTIGDVSLFAGWVEGDSGLLHG